MSLQNDIDQLRGRIREKYDAFNALTAELAECDGETAAMLERHVAERAEMTRHRGAIRARLIALAVEIGLPDAASWADRTAGEDDDPDEPDKERLKEVIGPPEGGRGSIRAVT